MNKRTFIKLSSTLMAAPLILPIKDFAQDETLMNWSGNIEYSTNNISYPESVAAVQQAVTAHSKLKVLGTKHCFNRIADSKHLFISSRKMNKILSLDKDAHTVTVEAGIKYGELSPWLNDQGFALHNLASLPHISVAGAITTATHGSGVKNGNLSTAVSGLEMVLADGSIVHLSKKDGDIFNAAVVGLGALGVITKVTLAIQPAFMMRQYVYENLPMQQLQQHFDAIVGAGYSVSLFTDWTTDSINEVWIKSRVDDAANSSAKADFFGAIPATKNVHPIIALSAENCTEQMGVPGAWYERLPHFKMGFTPSSGKELQSEYFVPHQHATEAIMAIQQLGKAISPHLFISEIRTIAADDLWMSPCYQQDSVTLHFTWKQEWDAVSKLLPQIEKALAPFNAKPHWGKLFTMPADVLDSRYEKLADFKQLVARYDPQGKFRNAFLEEKLYGG
ncbi:FAD-binding protein [Ilyomonas limi]|uniref:FAD-binding protein n=1 Tax=Ilyomonas limi TaxID=2575867 RepID=A0A4U3LB73_9BACT|nr:FAD-binding protein [Ilyomonas limi]TKK71734.1 FAD-binding protein [Ilyomonas limi]